MSILRELYLFKNKGINNIRKFFAGLLDLNLLAVTMINRDRYFQYSINNIESI